MQTQCQISGVEEDDDDHCDGHINMDYDDSVDDEDHVYHTCRINGDKIANNNKPELISNTDGPTKKP